MTLETLAQHTVVLDGAVVDDCQRAVGADVGMGIDVIGLAVGGPARVGYAAMALDIF